MTFPLLIENSKSLPFLLAYMCNCLAKALINKYCVSSRGTSRQLVSLICSLEESEHG